MRSILVVLMGLICGAVMAQAPEFIQQYTQRLGGWRDAYALQLSDLDKRAKKFGLSREDYITALQFSNDPKAVNEGNHLALLPGYYDRLNQAHKQLTTAGPVNRIFVFYDHYNGALAQSVWSDYKPAVPTNTEGAIFGGAGFVLGALGIFLVGVPFRIIGGLRARIGGARGTVGADIGGRGSSSGRLGGLKDRIVNSISRLRQRFSK